MECKLKVSPLLNITIMVELIDQHKDTITAHNLSRLNIHVCEIYFNFISLP